MADRDSEVLDKLARAMMTVELNNRPRKTLEEALLVPSEISRTYKRLLASGEASQMLAEIEKLGMIIRIVEKEAPHA